MKKLLILLALVLAPASFTACGGNDSGDERSASDEAQIRAVIDLGNSKNTAICDKLTDKWMKDVVAGDRKDCEQQVKQSPKDAVEIDEVSVNGDRATVTAQIQGDPGRLFLAHEEGEWKLDDIQQDGQ